MPTTSQSQIRAVVSSLIIVAAFLIAMPSISLAEDMTVGPHKIVLNAKGNFEDVQAVIRMPMTPGYVLADWQVTMSFNSILVSEAYAFRYCPIDDNFLASFDRTALQANPDVIAMANTTVVATVEGWYTGVASDGDSYTHEFFCTELVEIVDPDVN